MTLIAFIILRTSLIATPASNVIPVQGLNALWYLQTTSCPHQLRQTFPTQCEHFRTYVESAFHDEASILKAFSDEVIFAQYETHNIVFYKVHNSLKARQWQNKLPTNFVSIWSGGWLIVSDDLGLKTQIQSAPLTTDQQWSQAWSDIKSKDIASVVIKPKYAFELLGINPDISLTELITFSLHARNTAISITLRDYNPQSLPLKAIDLPQILPPQEYQLVIGIKNLSAVWQAFLEQQTAFQKTLLLGQIHWWLNDIFGDGVSFEDDIVALGEDYVVVSQSTDDAYNILARSDSPDFTKTKFEKIQTALMSQEKANAKVITHALDTETSIEQVVLCADCQSDQQWHIGHHHDLITFTDNAQTLSTTLSNHESGHKTHEWSEETLAYATSEWLQKQTWTPAAIWENISHVEWSSRDQKDSSEMILTIVTK